MALAPSAGAAGAPAGQLGHAERWITEAHGRVVLLHGVNMVYKLPPYVPADTGFSDDDAQFLADNGFNSVRLGVIYTAVEPQPGHYDDVYLERVRQTVRVLAAHGIYVLLDFHQDMYNERFQGEGFPDWSVQDDGLPAQPQVGFPGNYLVQAALNRAIDHFWQNAPGPRGVGLQDRYAAAWRHVAERFVNEPFVMGYDLLNEPWPGSQWPTCANPAGCPLFDIATLTAFSKRAIAGIRKVDRRNLVWYEPLSIFNFGADSSHADTGDPRAGFSFHNYCLFAGVIPGASLPNPPQDQACGTAQESIVLQNADKQSQETGDALLLSEFGATDDLGLLSRMVTEADAHRVSWQYWHYCICGDPTTSGTGGIQSLVDDPSKPPAGSNVRAAKLAVLSRVFPRAVAGTPIDWTFDPETRLFKLRYSTRRAGGGKLDGNLQTEIFVPSLHYPGGYEVEVSGAQVTSAPGAQILRLATNHGAAEVSVRVGPA